MKFLSNDLIFMIGLLLIVCFVLLLSQFKLLPKKSIPYILAALAGALGIKLLSRYKRKIYRNRIENDLKENASYKAQVEARKAASEVSLREYQRLRGECIRVEEAAAMERILIDTRASLNKKKIRERSDEDVLRRLSELTAKSLAQGGQ